MNGHGGYPTPSYDDAPMRRRLDSLELFGHTGASVFGSSTLRLAEAARGYSAGVDPRPLFDRLAQASR